MIDKKFIDSAVQIRKKYLKLRGGLDSYELQLKNLVAGFQDLVGQLSKIQEDIDTKKVTEAEDARNKILKVVADYKDKMDKINGKIQSIDSDVQKLKKEELELYNQIKRKHPSLNDPEIVEEISKSIEA